TPIIFHPRVISFYHERGVNIWEADFRGPTFDPDDEILSECPWKLSLTFSYDSDTLEVVLDGDLNVIECIETTKE
ncbi:MAG: hypothetical protein ABEI52_09655, partial [Halobacteriaceae archaeon]